MHSQELEAIRHLFEAAEKESAPDKKLSLLEAALDCFDDFVADNKGLPELEVAENMRRSNLRRLLTQLAGMRRDIDLTEWFGYIKVFFLRVQPEVASITSVDPLLHQSYRSFVDLWREDLLSELKNEHQ